MSAAREHDNTIDSPFAARLRQAAEAVDGQSELARRAGMSLSGLRRYLAGGEPTLSKLVALARAANVDITWLATGEGEMRARPPGADWQAMRDDFAKVVKAVEEAVAGYGWQCGPAEKTEMVLAVSSLVWDRADEGLEPWDFGEIMRAIREVHERHSRKDE